MQVLAIFTLTIFTSAFLLFLVQPMFARMLLPLLGGAPSVWNTALVFYQAALLGGYSYAHLASRRLRLRWQAVLHIALMLIALSVLPIGSNPDWHPPTVENPIPWLLKVMALSVGLPYFLVSATSPLLQKWFAATKHRCATDPYFLYAASNLGSMLALLSYPAAVEPLIGLQLQGRLWSLGFGFLVLLMVVCAAFVVRGREVSEITQPMGSELLEDLSEPGGAGIARQSSSSIGPAEGLLTMQNQTQRARMWRWVALAFVPSSLMLSVTTYMTTDLAAVPLLWVIPLAIYLLSFVLVFARRPMIPHLWMVKAVPVIVLPLAIALNIHGTDPLALVIALHLLAFFLISMVCHGELARDRPPVEDLTRFYLLISVGGTLGGVFNALVAPMVFDSIAEYPIVVTLACLLLPWGSAGSKAQEKAKDLLLSALTLLFTVGLILTIRWLMPESGPLPIALMFGLPSILVFSFSRRPLRFGLSVGALLLAGVLVLGTPGDILYKKRSFFGVTAVAKDPSGRFRQIFHGNTVHGAQWIDSRLQDEPIFYYARSGPLGQFFESRSGSIETVGIIGLGAGAIAPYAKAGQEWTYFEIDPVVDRIASDGRFFTYLRDCAADLRVIMGDGRMSLSGIRDNTFDVLIFDAYSSDAIPVHLLTSEALQLYMRKIAARGVLVFHVSNRYLDLEPVLGNLAQEARLDCLTQYDTTISEAESDLGKTPSKYVIMARKKSDLGPISDDTRWTPARTSPSVGVWTDDYSSVLSIMKWRR